MADSTTARDPAYQLGFEHGFAAAQTRTQEPRQTSRLTYWLAAGTFAAGLGTLAVYALAERPRYRDTARALTITGILFGSFASAALVLAGRPTPTLGIEVR